MRWMTKPLHIAALFLLSQACNTLQQSSLVDLEIVEPAKVIFPADISQVAVRYNNTYLWYNSQFETHNAPTKPDQTNTNSPAELLYFESFVENLRESLLFDTVRIVEAAHPDEYKTTTDFIKSDAPAKDEYNGGVALLAELHRKAHQKSKKHILLDPELGLYAASELQQIQDTTGADLLMSLDYLAIHKNFSAKGSANSVQIIPVWNFYNLNEKELEYYYNLSDIKAIPKRADIHRKAVQQNLVQEVATTAGWLFANYLVPHWILVQRRVYESGNRELRKAQKLVEENKWIKAAEIWKKNTYNKNNNIAAKSMYNLAVACEINGEMDAAMDWVVKSYNALEQKNEEHQFNCRDYLRILARRKQDFKKIDLQLNTQSAAY